MLQRRRKAAFQWRCHASVRAVGELQIPASLGRARSPQSLPRRIGVEMRVGGNVGGQDIEIVENCLGTKILTRRMPRQAGSVLKPQTIREPAKPFLNPPLAMGQGTKHGERESNVIQQQLHYHVYPPVRRNHSHQTNRRRRRRALAILRIACILCAQYQLAARSAPRVLSAAASQRHGKPWLRSCRSSARSRSITSKSIWRSSNAPYELQLQITLGEG